MDNADGFQLTLRDFWAYEEQKLGAERARHLLFATQGIAPSAKFKLMDNLMNSEATREAIGNLVVSQIATNGNGGLIPLSIPTLPPPQAEEPRSVIETDSDGRTSVDSLHGGRPESLAQEEDNTPGLEYTPNMVSLFLKQSS